MPTREGEKKKQRLCCESYYIELNRFPAMLNDSHNNQSVNNSKQTNKQKLDVYCWKQTQMINESITALNCCERYNHVVKSSQANFKHWPLL